MIKPEDMKILLVDDETTLREIVAMQIEEDGYKVIQAASGDEAFEIVKRQKIHLIISDMRMPNGNGESLLRNISTLPSPKPEFILVTGFSELSKKEILDLGARDMLSKPIDFDLLENHIKDVQSAL